MKASQQPRRAWRRVRRESRLQRIQLAENLRRWLSKLRRKLKLLFKSFSLGDTPQARLVAGAALLGVVVASSVVEVFWGLSLKTNESLGSEKGFILLPFCVHMR